MDVLVNVLIIYSVLLFSFFLFSGRLKMTLKYLFLKFSLNYPLKPIKLSEPGTLDGLLHKDYFFFPVKMTLFKYSVYMSQFW